MRLATHHHHHGGHDHGHGASMAAHDEVADRRTAARSLVFSALGLAITGAIELAIALVTRSAGLLGDAFHNLSDVSTSALVAFGFAVSKRRPNRRYPFGYERAEDLAGLLVAVVIWASAVVAGVASVRKLTGHATTVHVGLGMVAAVIGMAGNQAVALYKGRAGRRIHSAALIADARHSWLDAVSSLGALLGLVAVATGHPLGDPIAGLAVTAFVVHVGWEVTAGLVDRLMDGVDPEVLDAARAAAEAVPGVRAVEVVGRWTGRSLRLDVAASLDAATPLAVAGQVATVVERDVLAAVHEARVVRVSMLPAAGAGGA